MGDDGAGVLMSPAGCCGCCCACPVAKAKQQIDGSRLPAERPNIPALTDQTNPCLCLQDFLGRVNLDMEGMARSIPPTLRMLCLHGTADKTIPYQVQPAIW